MPAEGFGTGLRVVTPHDFVVCESAAYVIFCCAATALTPSQFRPGAASGFAACAPFVNYGINMDVGSPEPMQARLPSLSGFAMEHGQNTRAFDEAAEGEQPAPDLRREKFLD
jgi:hypothetical protein